MHRPILQFAATGLAAWFPGGSRRLRRGRRQSCRALLAQLRTDWSAHQLSSHFLWRTGLDATVEDVWQRLEGPRGLLTIFQNARVLFCIADYAAGKGGGADPALLAGLRTDVVQIRLCVLMALAQYAFSHAGAGVRDHALRAASLYTGLAARITCLLQEKDATLLPDFVAAM
jgi:hypothetical protein